MNTATIEQEPATNTAIVIYGPPGCGKTHNAAALAKHYGKTTIIEHQHGVIDNFPADALILTSDESLQPAIHFDDAMRAAGLTLWLAPIADSISAIPPRIGADWPSQGGIYAGILRGEAGAPDYHLIVATHPDGNNKSVAWGGRGKDEPGANSNIDGHANTAALCASKIEHPAAQWAAALSIEGHADYYLPARHELRLCYLNVPELFETDDWYWSSTQYAPNPSYAWGQGFSYGYQNGNGKSCSARARAVRRLSI